MHDSSCTWKRIAGMLMLGLASPVLADPVASDDCSSAPQVGEGTYAFDLTQASGTPGLSSACDQPPEVSDILADAWLDYVPSGTGFAVVHTALLPTDTLSAVSVFGACTGGELACNFNWFEDGTSAVSLPVVSGQHYLVRVSSVEFIVGTGQVRIALVPACQPGLEGAPANDCCENATPVGDGTFPFTTVGATRDYGGSCDQLDSNPDVWFDYVAAATGHARVRPTLDTDWIDVGVTVLDGSCSGELLECAANQLYEGDVRHAVFPTVAGHHYLVRLHNIHFEIPIPEAPTPATVTGGVRFESISPPVNDECDTATNITGLGEFAYDNTLANDSGPDDAPACHEFLFGADTWAIAHDVWFRWTCPADWPADTDASISTCGGVFIDTKMAVYPDGCPVGQPLDCNDDDPECFSPASRVTFTAHPNVAYLVRIGNFPDFQNQPGPDGAPGTFTIEQRPSCIVAPMPGDVTEPEPCGEANNDGCTVNGTTTEISCGTTTIFGTASVNDLVPDLDIYRVVLPVETDVSMSIVSEFPALIAVLDTANCPPDLINRNRFTINPCEDPPVEVFTHLSAGTYDFGVVNLSSHSPCGGKNNYRLTISVATCEPSGRCCIAGESCQVLPHSACVAAHGSWGGDDSACPPPGGNYVATTCADGLEDISATGAPGPACDDCGGIVDLGFTFHFYGQAFTSVHVSSNGFLTFSDAQWDGAPGLFVPLPNPDVHAIIAPLWANWTTEGPAGGVFTQTLGSAGHRRFVVLWKDVPSVDFSGAVSTFEAVLHEDTGAIDFRYGAIAGIDFAATAVCNDAGDVAATFPQPSSDSCSSLALVIEPDPCAPACAADFDGSGGVGVADLFAFLDAWFAQFPGGTPGEPNADFDRSGAVTVADLFGFLDAWFAEFGTCGV